MRQGSDTLCRIGVEVERLTSLILLAEVYKKIGRSKEGLALFAEAMAVMDKTKAHWLEAELYRLKGELLLAQAREQATGNEQQGKVTDP